MAKKPAKKTKTVEVEVNPVGRPSAYKPEYAKQTEKLCFLGATDADLADFFAVTIRTIDNWKARYPEFAQALKPGKNEADDRVERSLYQRALGYEYDAVKVFNDKGKAMLVEYREKVPPDTTAAQFWLKNRRPDVWRDVQKHEHGGVGDFTKMTDDELNEVIAEHMQDVAADGAEKGKTKH